MVALDIDDNSIVLHDPGKSSGDFRKFTIKQFQTSWEKQKNTYVLIPVQTPISPPKASPPPSTSSSLGGSKGMVDYDLEFINTPQSIRVDIEDVDTIPLKIRVRNIGIKKWKQSDIF